MANENQSRLINQAQFKRLGNDFHDYYVTRDLKYLSNAINILQNKVNYINKNYIPKVTGALQDKMGYSDSQYTEWFVDLLNNASPKELRELANKNNALAKQTSSNTGHEEHTNGVDASAHSNSHDNHHDHKNDHHDHDNHSNHDHGHKNPKESNSDIDFLNNMNK